MEVAYAEALAEPEGKVWRRVTTPSLNRPESRNFDLIAALSWLRHDPLTELSDRLRKFTGRTDIFFAPSGQCALAQILSVLPQEEVVMPAFTCSAVKTAAQVGGKRIVYVDLAEGSVNSTSQEFAKAAKPGRILLATHQFGVPTDIDAICELARQTDCIVIEDSVAAFGGCLNGQPLGTFGDFGIYSFHRAKRLPAFRGGAIVINNERAAAFKAGAARVVEQGSRLPLREIVEAFVYNLASIPWVYGRFTVPQLLRRYAKPIVASDPNSPPTQLDDETAAAISRASSSPDYTRALHPYQAELVLRILDRINEIRDQIAQLAQNYVDAFRGTPWQTFLPSRCDLAGLLRFPIAFPSQRRAQILRRAMRHGLYLEVEYETLLPPHYDRERFPNARWAAENLILLPLYKSLSLTKAEALVSTLLRFAEDSTATERFEITNTVVTERSL